MRLPLVKISEVTENKIKAQLKLLNLL